MLPLGKNLFPSQFSQISCFLLQRESKFPAKISHNSTVGIALGRIFLPNIASIFDPTVIPKALNLFGSNCGGTLGFNHLGYNVTAGSQEREFKRMHIRNYSQDYSKTYCQIWRNSSFSRSMPSYSSTTVEPGYIGSLQTAKFIRYIRNPIYTRKLLLLCTMGTGNFIRYIRLSDITESDVSEFYCIDNVE